MGKRKEGMESEIALKGTTSEMETEIQESSTFRFES